MHSVPLFLPLPLHVVQVPQTPWFGKGVQAINPLLLGSCATQGCSERSNSPAQWTAFNQYNALNSPREVLLYAIVKPFYGQCHTECLYISDPFLVAISTFHCNTTLLLSTSGSVCMSSFNIPCRVLTIQSKIVFLVIFFTGYNIAAYSNWDFSLWGKQCSAEI